MNKILIVRLTGEYNEFADKAIWGQFYLLSSMKNCKNFAFRYYFFHFCEKLTYIINDSISQKSIMTSSTKSSTAVQERKYLILIFKVVHVLPSLMIF